MATSLSRKVVWSCVVDGAPKFEWQAFLWAQSLLRNAGCDVRDLRAHCTPAVSKEFRELLGGVGVATIEIAPFPGHPYCNKIQQCFSDVFARYDAVALTDCDLFFVARAALPSDAGFAGKIVDLPNPPAGALLRIYEARGIAPSRLVPVGCALSAGETTTASNLNGGLYLLDPALLRQIGERWRDHASWLLGSGLMGEFANHVDQVSLALTLDELKVPVTHLDARANYPLHLPSERLERVDLPGIAALHYHSLLEPGMGELRKRGLPNLDAAIGRANASIAAILRAAEGDPVYEAWRRARSARPSPLRRWWRRAG